MAIFRNQEGKLATQKFRNILTEPYKKIIAVNTYIFL